MSFPEVSVEAAFGANLTSSITTWSWTELGDRVKALKWTGPRRNDLAGQVQGGTLNLIDLDNSDSYLDPRNGAAPSPYAAGGRSRTRPRLPVRWRARFPTGSGPYIPLGLGYRTGGALTSLAPSGSKASWSCIDGMWRLNVGRSALAVGVGAGELTGPRVGRVLDSISWPVGDRNLDPGLTPCQATNLSGSALTELQAVAATEAGDLFFAGDGTLVFRGRARRLVPGTPKWSFSDSSPTMDPTTIDVSDDGTNLINRANYQRVGGLPQQVDNAASQGDYGIVDRSRTDLVAEDDNWVRALAEGVVLTYSDWQPRITSLVLSPSVNDALWPVVFDIGIGDYITVTEAGAPQPLFVEGVDYDVTGLNSNGAQNWTVTVWTLNLSTVLPYSSWDSGSWDSTVWAY